MSSRFLLIGLLLTVCLSGCQGPSENEIAGDWKVYRSRFVAADGRVIDTGNGNISHSEGQGYGMILSVYTGDQATFERIWQWTQSHLQVRQDHLFIWRRRPGTDLADEDKNDAADGDIMIAWALFEAAAKWRQPRYQQEAVKIIDDIKRTLIVRRNGLTLLLPGVYGFQADTGTTINLSYWVYPALRAFSVHDADPLWQELIAGGLALLQQARYGRWQLPPDWLELKNDGSVTSVKTKRFGYDAIRVPLYLVFAGIGNELLAPFVNYWSFYRTYTPAWISLTENVMDSYGAGAGISAVKQLTLAASTAHTAAFDAVDKAGDYYSATLLLISKLGYRQLLQR